MAPNADHIFVGDRQGAISMWYQESDKATFVDEIRVNRQQRRFVVHPDGTRIYGVNLDGELTEWHTTPDSIETVSVIGNLDGAVSAIAISDQGSLLAAGSSSGSVHLFTISDGEVAQVTVLPGDAAVESLAFSGDGKWLYAGADLLLRGWSVEQPNGLPAIVMRGHHFESIDVTRDGTRLVSGGHGEEVPCLWWLRPDDLLQVARRKTGSGWTDEPLDRFTIGTSGKQ